jgi:diguanylate cyclase (GGDEF)-like protein
VVRRLVHAGLPAAGFAAADTAAVFLGRATRLEESQISLVWPAAAVGVLWALYLRRLPRPRAVVHWLMMGAANIGAAIATGADLGVAVWFAGVNLALAAVTSEALARGRPSVVLREPADLARLVAAVGAGTIVAATLSVAFLAAVGHDELLETFALFAVRNGVTALAGVAIVLRLKDAQWRRPRWTGARIAETLGCALVTAVVFGRVYWFNPGHPIAFAVMLPALWVALRYSTTTSTVFTGVGGASIVAATLLDRGALHGLPPEQQAVLAQGMVGSLTLVVLAMALFRDSRNALIAELRHLALHDPLTGLANRTLLHQRLEAALAQDAPGTVGVLMLDLDGFKLVNDAWGHEEGDLLLGEIARRLVETTRPDDTVARLGGDEFVVMCPGIGDPAELDMLAERVRRAVARPYGLASDAPYDRITASVGAAVSERSSTPRSLMAQADQAMYGVKRSARARTFTAAAARSAR